MLNCCVLQITCIEHLTNFTVKSYFYTETDVMFQKRTSENICRDSMVLKYQKTTFSSPFMFVNAVLNATGGPIWCPLVALNGTSENLAAF